jgi:putative ABC transport system permease protein
MKNALYLACKSLLWHRGRSFTIVLSLAITIWLPVTVRLVLDQFRREISERANATPLVLGAKGSRIDLALHALYFNTVPPADTTMAEVNSIDELSNANAPTIAIPLHVRYRTQSRPGLEGAVIVGTSPEYFEFRRLKVGSGQMVSLLGDCVVGSNVAKRMQLQAGDSVLSAPRNAFNLAGDYPLKMNVVGVLSQSHSPDDDAVFTDVRTTWVIDGIGHGHQELNTQTDSELLLKNDGSSRAVTANAAVLPFTEITPENIDSFHFHGDPESFPLTAIIAVPKTDKARTQILGRYSSSQATSQCLRPPEVIDELLSIVFRIEQLAWFCSIAAGIVTCLLLGLVVNLSMRLRSTEMQTMFRLGCSRATIAMLHGSEVLLLLLAASILSSAAALLTLRFAASVLRSLLF